MTKWERESVLLLYWSSPSTRMNLVKGSLGREGRDVAITASKWGSVMGLSQSRWDGKRRCVGKMFSLFLIGGPPGTFLGWSSDQIFMNIIEPRLVLVHGLCHWGLPDNESSSIVQNDRRQWLRYFAGHRRESGVKLRKRWRDELSYQDTLKLCRDEWWG